MTSQNTVSISQPNKDSNRSQQDEESLSESKLDCFRTSFFQHVISLYF